MFSKLFGRKRASPADRPAIGRHAPSRGGDGPAAFADLRSRALGMKPADLGLDPGAGDQVVCGVVLDMAAPGGTATLVGFTTGDASLYLSHGGGIIGGMAQAEVRDAAVLWIRTAQEALAHFEPVDAFPLPSGDLANIYVLTPGGVRFATADQGLLNSGTLPQSRVWLVGQGLLARLIKSTKT